MIRLWDHQKKAVEELKTGSILCGGVGSGKSMAALAYYYDKECGGYLTDDGDIHLMERPKDLYIITTARKRDTHEWRVEMSKFLLSPDPEVCPYNIKVVVDSWNNIAKYVGAQNAFFIFDEQRLVGKGVWVKAFLKIAKQNRWILLSATPGDTWLDYIPVFIANGFYRNRTEFVTRHVLYKQGSKFPKVDRYIEQNRLIRLRREILVTMPHVKKTIPHVEKVYTQFDKEMFDQVLKKRWNPYESYPIKDVAEMYRLMRKVVNSDLSRLEAVMDILEKHKKVLIFYNFNFELNLLLLLANRIGVKAAQWNGHKHESTPDGETWMYLIQYAAGAEGWNCIETDTTIFYSYNYSYKIMHQASGRIDRNNTPFTDLYYYYLTSRSWIDSAISKSLDCKKNFTEQAVNT